MTLTTWDRIRHTITGWQFYTLPPAERVDVWRDRSEVHAAVDFDWPTSFHTVTLGGQTPWRATSHGVGMGTPMQHGTAATRPLTWGYAQWGIQNHTTIPRPASGWYWTTGYPNPVFDRHCVVAAPDGAVHEMIQLDPTAPRRSLPWPNQALSWSKWVDGKLVDGKACTVIGGPLHAYLWTPWSSTDPHVQRLVLHDYVGGDGVLTVGPLVGTRWRLRPGSQSHTRNMLLGGEAARRAAALVQYGCVLGDRSGYVDAPTESQAVGRRPQPSNLSIQPGAQWRDTNIGAFVVDVTDLQLATHVA